MLPDDTDRQKVEGYLAWKWGLQASLDASHPYKDAPLGVIKEGAWADMLIYSANPLEDIGVVVDHENQLKVVMKGGKVYKNELK